MANDARESRTRPDQYTIAWICALHMEMAAARAMLDGVHGDLPRDGNDSNAYTLGNIGRHNVVIACLSAAQYGLTNAATVLTHLVRTFTSIRACLMVGIGGAAPSQADIRLGDIVVGTRVMQYDLGKIVGDGQIQRTAIPKILSQLLGTAVSTLRSAHELEPSQIPSILLEKFEGYSGYGRPTSPDCLFLSTYDHVSPTPDCDECDHSKLVPRRKRATVDPLVHYGAIASGNQVMRNGNQRDKISQQLEVMCFEMESAALMDILPCLPIRGICDYSDTHKNKEWQRYAAAAAASYARELLMVLPVAEAHGRVAYLAHSRKLWLSGSWRIWSDVRGLHSTIDRDSSNDRRQQLLDSLRFDQMDARKSTIKAAHTKTCRWFLKHHDYQAWLDPAKLTQHHGFLWIRGKPGAGKSTIMKFAYSHICKSRHAHAITAAFFFNARGEYLERSIVGMYRSLLLQLLQGCSELQAVLDDPDLVSESQSGCPPLNVLKELFLGAILALGQRSFTCFIDALDECDEQQVMDMVQYFEDLAEQSTEKRIAFRICFSSRHYPYIIVRQGIQFTVEDQPDHVEDLSTYIASRLRINDPAFVGELQPKLLEKAAGVFLWVVLVVDILNKDYRCGGLALRKRLAEIPSGLSDLFKDILRRDTENMEHLLLCVLWILCAKRPLRPEEFYYALCSGLSLKGLADPELPAVAIGDAGGNAIRSVISSSKGLAEVTKPSNRQFNSSMNPSETTSSRTRASMSYGPTSDLTGRCRVMRGSSNAAMRICVTPRCMCTSASCQRRPDPTFRRKSQMSTRFSSMPVSMFSTTPMLPQAQYPKPSFYHGFQFLTGSALSIFLRSTDHVATPRTPIFSIFLRRKTSQSSSAQGYRRIPAPTFLENAIIIHCLLPWLTVTKLLLLLS
jgi:nucleoside phosphorylase